MLKKLLKYDLKWSYRSLSVFYILAIFFSIIARVINKFNDRFIFMIIGKICYGIVISMLINIIINNLMGIWARTVRNIYRDESYLTHTIPVNRKTIFTSKVLSALITMLASSIVVVISLIITYINKDSINIIKDLIEKTEIYLNSSIYSFLITVIITVFFELFFMLMSGILGIIIGHRSNNLKIVKSVAAGLIAYIIPSTISILIIYIVGLFNPEVMNLFNSSTFDTEALKIILYAGTTIYIIYNIIYYFIGKRILEKGVNID